MRRAGNFREKVKGMVTENEKSPKYTTARALRGAIERYLDSISRSVCVTEEYLTGELDEKGKPIKSERPMLSDRGGELYTRQWVAAPSESGLCLALGISMREWESYSSCPELRGQVERMRTIIRAYLEGEISTRQKNLTGLIWQLQRATAAGEGDIEPTESMSIDERCEILKNLGVDV